MNKKGLDYAVLLMFIVLAGVVAAYLAVTVKVDGVQRNIGELQGNVLRLNGDTEFYELFIQQSASRALREALWDISIFPELQNLPGTDCGILNTEEQPKKLLKPDIQNALNISFNKYLDEYMKDYSELTSQPITVNNFELYAEKGKLIGVSIMPTKFKFSESGVAFFRPAFEINYNHALEKYTNLYKTLQMIAKDCSAESDVAKCVSDTVGNIKFEQNGNMFAFYSKAGSVDFCYELILPGQQTKSQNNDKAMVPAT